MGKRYKILVGSLILIVILLAFQLLKGEKRADISTQKAQIAQVFATDAPSEAPNGSSAPQTMVKTVIRTVTVTPKPSQNYTSTPIITPTPNIIYYPQPVYSPVYIPQYIYLTPTPSLIGNQGTPTPAPTPVPTATPTPTPDQTPVPTPYIKFPVDHNFNNFDVINYSDQKETISQVGFEFCAEHLFPGTTVTALRGDGLYLQIDANDLIPMEPPTPCWTYTGTVNIVLYPHAYYRVKVDGNTGMSKDASMQALFNSFITTPNIMVKLQ
ncbi:MAG: hypothetical protein A3A33_00210 [Candidatus Yanofskybacteria bacterium RIFCSPLOWO2_01_FULL_49_25]|uniref:Uncharacterized protein n=1 Tax=Candidatus Yanofskybacteria bacterium RIFCSPLOWO2_01_FULL_49_25 TaxID=1802701 RepID=A0A1F8GWP5_9BACT|nr:MAG: hypothetical protein A3A33_00210 [Candidatus Yanofskybacteria bacterium RIFCSPLOWO2_01_FULL_49_25]